MERELLPADYIKGYILFKKGYVTIKSGGFAEVKSERYPNERAYIIRFFGDADYEHSCGATAKNRDAWCKHLIACQFTMFPATSQPSEEVVEAFEFYRRNFSSRTFNKDMELYELKDMAVPKFADYLWMCLFARLVTEKTPKLVKNRIKEDYEDLISNGKYLTATLKAFKKQKPLTDGKNENQIIKVFNKVDGKNLNDIIAECEEEGIDDAKAIIYRAFKEELFIPKKLRETYLKAYKDCSVLNWLFNSNMVL